MENKFKEGEYVIFNKELWAVKCLMFNIGYILTKIDEISNRETFYFVTNEDLLNKYEVENNNPKINWDLIINNLEYVKRLLYTSGVTIKLNNKTNENMENKEFTIDDLKSGMIVETRSEEKYLVIKDCEFYGGDKGIAFVNATGFNKSNSYNKDLTCKKMKSYDIMKVYYDDCINGETHSMKYQPLIWQRKEKQSFTKEQIAERLGLSIDEFDIK